LLWKKRRLKFLEEFEFLLLMKVIYEIKMPLKCRLFNFLQDGRGFVWWEYLNSTRRSKWAFFEEQTILGVEDHIYQIKLLSKYRFLNVLSDRRAFISVWTSEFNRRKKVNFKKEKKNSFYQMNTHQDDLKKDEMVNWCWWVLWFEVTWMITHWEFYNWSHPSMLSLILLSIHQSQSDIQINQKSLWRLILRCNIYLFYNFAFLHFYSEI
jgi:hypothetical protein